MRMSKALHSDIDPSPFSHSEKKHKKKVDFSLYVANQKSSTQTATESHNGSFSHTTLCDIGLELSCKSLSD